MLAVVITFALAVPAAAVTNLAQVTELIAADRIADARLALRQAAFTEDHFGWEYLNLCLNSDGAQAAQQARLLIDYAPDAERRCDLAIRYAQYCLMAGTYDDLAIIRASERSTQTAPRHDRLTLLLARLEFAQAKYRNAEKRLRKLAAVAADPELNWQSLILLAETYAARGRADRAAAILAQFAARPDNPYSARARAQLAALSSGAAQASSASASPDNASSADDTSVTAAFSEASNRQPRSLAQLFAVRVGEFAHEIDARRLHGKLLKQGYTVRLRTNSDGTRDTFAVDLGRFSSAAAAARFKQRFERQTRKTYAVVSL